MDERVNIARRKAENPGKARRLIEKAKEHCIQNIQINWLNSIPETIETAGGTFLVTACVVVGKKGLYSYSFDLPNDEEVIFSTWSEAAGIIKEIVDKLSQMVEREVKYEIRNRTGYWSLEASFYW